MSAAMVIPATRESEREHPIVAWLAVAAIVVASLLIAWARFEVHGTGDLVAALNEEPEAIATPRGDTAAQDAQAVDDAVAAGRWVSIF
jgi:hypothetical protein